MKDPVHAPKVLEIVASTRPGRIGRSVADWFLVHAAARSDLTFEIADLAEWNLPFLDEPLPAKMGTYRNEHTRRWSAKVAGADGILVVTPEYNHGYPAALKNAVDYLYHEWEGKPVAFVSYGIGAGRLAVAQLTQVVEAVGMRRVAGGVAIRLQAEMFDEDGRLVEPRLSLSGYSAAATGLIDSLADELAAQGAAQSDVLSR